MPFMMMGALPAQAAEVATSRAVPPDAPVPTSSPPAAVVKSTQQRRSLVLPASTFLPARTGINVSAAVPPQDTMVVAGGVEAEAPIQPIAAVVTVVAASQPKPRPAVLRPARGDTDEVRCVAQAVFHEARGESLRGQKAVADVVMNRARSGKWGRNACAVVNAPGQFSNRWSWRAPQIGVDAWDHAVAIARDAVSGAVGISGRLMNFRAARMGSGGLGALRIGNHVFW